MDHRAARTSDSSAYFEATVNALAARLGHPILVETPDLRVVAYTPQNRVSDPVRLSTILNRSASEDVVHFVAGLRLDRCSSAVRVPAAPELEMGGRVCVPMRDRGTLLGYVWILDPLESLGSDQLDAVDAAASDLAAAWGRLMEAGEGGAHARLLEMLTGGSHADTVAAEGEIVELGIFSEQDEVVVHAAGSLDPLRSADLVAAGAVVLPEVKSWLRSKHALAATLDDAPLLVVRSDLAITRRTDERLLEVAAATVGFDLLVGSSSPGRLTDLLELIDQARFATDVARVLQGQGNRTLRWEDLGTYKLLWGASCKKADAFMHPGLIKLLNHPSGDTLLGTLECYLENACDAKRTSSELFLHRTSLYYRLSKIEELAGVNMHQGDDRLSLHLGLKLARLKGLLSSGPTDALGGVVAAA